MKCYVLLILLISLFINLTYSQSRSEIMIESFEAEDYAKTISIVNEMLKESDDLYYYYIRAACYLQLKK